MEQKFTAKKLLSILIVLTMLFTSFATFMVPVSAAEYAAGLTVEVDGEQVSWLGGYTLDEVEALLSNGDAYTTPTGGSADWNAGGGVVAMQNLKCADSTIHPEINLIWNFEEATEIDTVDLGLYAVPNSMIGFPETEIAVAISDDGAEWTSAGTVDTGLVVEDTSNNTGFTETVSLTLAEAVTAQYIKLTLVFPDSPFIEQGKPVWEFVGLTEVAFSKSTSVEPTNVALNKTYEAPAGFGSYTANLTDGTASTEVVYNNSWYAFYCNNTANDNAPGKLGTVIVDLEDTYDVSEVKINVLDNKGSSGIHLPTSVKVYFSEDNAAWSEATALTIPTNESATACLVEGAVSGTARYVKIEIALGGTFCFLNEIEVYGVESVGHTCMGVGDWQSDETNHWKLCACGEKTDEDAHDEGTWVETTPAEVGVPGEETRKCTVCGYALETRPIDALPDLINLTQGNSYTSTLACSSSYADAGNAELTDGVVVTSEDCTAPYYADSRWVGYTLGSSPRSFDIEIPLGTGTKVYELSKVEVNVGGEGCTAGVAEPNFTVYYTTDGTNWTEFGSHTASGTGAIAYNITIEKATSVKATAIKINIGHPSKNLMWVGEIAAFGTELPEGEHICVGVGEWQKDETNHWKVCECGEKTDEDAHDEGEWVVAQAPVPGTDGTRELQCTVCGYAFDSEVIVAPIAAESYEATINGSYTANLNDGIKSTILTYNDSNWFAFNASNTTDNIGTVVFKLGKAYDLSEVKIHIYDHLGGSGIWAPVSANVFLSDDGETWGDAIALVIPTNTSSTACYVEGPVTGTAQYVKVELERNGFIFLNEIEIYGVESATQPPHECEGVGDWQSDETNHWKVCECGEKTDEGTHDEGTWVETTPAEVGVPGEETRKCTVCGYALETRPIDALPQPILPPDDADKSFAILTNGGFALEDCTIFVRLGDLTTIGEVAASLRGLEATDEDVDYNYYGLILVGADGKVVETNFNLGRDVEGGKKNEVVIPEGGYALLMHADNADYYSCFATIAKDDTIVLTNVDLEALATATEASELTDAYASLYKAPEPPLVDGELVDIDNYTVSDTAAWAPNDPSWAPVQGDDGVKLIDGVKGTNGLTNALDGWYFGANYPNGGEIEINLTLKELSEISDVAAYFFYYYPAGYNAVSEMKVSYSVDGENYTETNVASVKTDLNELAYPNFALTVALEEAVIAKYVKIVIPAPANSLVLTDEVEVYGEAHTCVAGEAWESDETNHWNVCACGEKMNEGAHDDGEWEVTTPAEIGVPGEESLKCTVCGHVLETRPIDALPELPVGDVNGDNKVDSIDYLFVKRYCFKTYELSEDEAIRADINGDEIIDSTDYILIKRIVFGTYNPAAASVGGGEADNQ